MIMKNKLSYANQKLTFPRSRGFVNRALSFKKSTMTHSKISILFLLLLLFAATFFSSCKKDRRLHEIAQILQEWQGKEILFPENIIFTIHGIDTVAYEIPLSPHKIVVYIDSVGCMSCRFHFDRWNRLIAEIDSLTNATVPVLFFFHAAANPRNITRHLQMDSLNIPVVFDFQDELNALNRFPTHQEFQTFLLDEDNRVVFIGNPINNFAIRELFLSTITDGRYQSVARSSPTTEIEVAETVFDLGTITRGDVQVVSVPIKNVGGMPLIIFDTRVSCSCTRVAFDRQPTLPNATLELSITHNADSRGRRFPFLEICLIRRWLFD